MSDIKSFAGKRNENCEEVTSRFKLDDKDFYYGEFPSNFWFGCGTAAYQVEGGWDADGKGPSVWDNLCHKNPKAIEDGTTGDVACDSYNKYREDVQLLKNMGANIYKFSISWPRVLPMGTTDNINKAGVEYYNNLIDNLLENGIEPLVTLWHWDTPQALSEATKGKCWADEKFIQLFTDYARFCFETFGDRVKHWLTINEPWIHTMVGYDLAIHPPCINEPEIGYQVIHNMLKGHGLSYRIYEKEFKDKQHGKVGISLDCWGILPADPESQEDLEATDIAFQFKFGHLAHPLFYGCYPPAMRLLIDKKSKEEGRATSRLPEFDEKWSSIVKGSADFIGLNHYTCEMVTTKGNIPEGFTQLKWSTGNGIGFDEDQDNDRFSHPSWSGSATWWLRVTPFALRPLLKRIKNEYKNPEIIIAENGFPDSLDKTEDLDRVRYFKAYINETLKAIHLDGCNVTGYVAWTLLDSWEWNTGHLVTFGVHSVDMTDPERKRKPRASALALTTIFKNNGFKKLSEPQYISKGQEATLLNSDRYSVETH